MCFPMNFAKYLRRPIWVEHLWMAASGGTLIRIYHVHHISLFYKYCLGKLESEKEGIIIAKLKYILLILV